MSDWTTDVYQRYVEAARRLRKGNDDDLSDWCGDAAADGLSRAEAAKAAEEAGLGHYLICGDPRQARMDGVTWVRLRSCAWKITEATDAK